MRAIARASGVFRAVLLLFLLPLPALGAADPLWHILAKGETLYSISRLYGVSPEALIAANGIKDPAHLSIGQRLLVPFTHRVSKGETLFGISQQYGVTVPELLRINRLRAEAVIKPGDLLVVPLSASASASASASGGTKANPATAPGNGRSAVSTSPTQSAAGQGAVTVTAANQGGTAPAPDPLSTTKTGTTPKVEGKTPSPSPSTSLVSGPARRVTTKTPLPCGGEARYLDGKLFGIAIKTAEGTSVKAVAGGTVVSAGPYRGFGSVAFVQSRSGLIFVYGGNSAVYVRVGDSIKPGAIIGKVGHDPLGGATEAYFFVFKGEKALDPVSAPRE